ncbi:type II toxin-antitoxin system RelE/ParE family toxin [Thioalkalivibrio sp. ALMg11]|uniref:type II toxin-antitoxin system RelE family toxin n=1 Tax=Thioalkalivibrio sp. ALMg11 TaxID=1158165 RepID=UPI00037D1D44|nr:type II toxin-antitoxin system RelE/ParE family toxin [Thioalkalivibrio sp. ALMg11]
MARFEVVVRQSVAQDLRRIPDKDVRRILERIASLADDPRPPGSEKLSAQERYRVRQGVYRILYEIKDDQLIITVVKIGHRREAYR